MINSISNSSTNPAIQTPSLPPSPASVNPATSDKVKAPEDQSLAPAEKQHVDGQVVIAKDPGGLLQDMGNLLFPNEPPKPGTLPSIDTPPSTPTPKPLEPTTVRFPTKD